MLCNQWKKLKVLQVSKAVNYSQCTLLHSNVVGRNLFLISAGYKFVPWSMKIEVLAIFSLATEAINHSVQSLLEYC